MSVTAQSSVSNEAELIHFKAHDLKPVKNWPWRCYFNEGQSFYGRKSIAYGFLNCSVNDLSAYLFPCNKPQGENSKLIGKPHQVNKISLTVNFVNRS